MFGKKNVSKEKKEINVSSASSRKTLKDLLSAPIGRGKKQSGVKVKRKSNKPLYKRKSNRFVAVDLGSLFIKFAVGSYQGGRIKVDRLFKVKLPDNLYADGSILDEKRFIELIKNELTSRKVKDVDIIVSIDSTTIIRRNMTLPALNELETEELIGFEFEEYLGINKDDYIIQHKVLREYENDGRKKDIQLDAVPKALAKKIFNVFKQAGCNPCILDVQSNFLENIERNSGINGSSSGADRTVAIVDIGNSGMVINVFKNGHSLFNRVVKDTTSIGRTLILDANMDDSSVTSVISGFKGKNLNSYIPSNDREEEAFGLVKNCIDSWALQIDKMLGYYRSRSIDNKIDKLYIYGGDTVLTGIDQYIEKRISTPTETIRTFSNLDVSKDVDFSEIPIYVNTISALTRM